MPAILVQLSKFSFFSSVAKLLTVSFMEVDVTVGTFTFFPSWLRLDVSVFYLLILVLRGSFLSLLSLFLVSSSLFLVSSSFDRRVAR